MTIARTARANLVFLGAGLTGMAHASACTEQELVSSVIVVDPVDGSELDRRSLAAESGYVRAGAMPTGRGDLLAWQIPDGLALRHEGEWREIGVGAHNIAFGPVSGPELPEIFGGAGTRALLWSAEDGSLLAEVESATFPWDVVAADWDGDGSADLVLNSPSFGVGFHARTAEGLGPLQPLFESIGLDQHMDVGDLDEDGRLDVVRHDSGVIDVAFGGPAGVIDEVLHIPVDVDDVDEVLLGDVTGDAKLDAVVGARDGIQVLENAGGRALEVVDSFSEMVSPMILVDYDNDGDLDILGQPPRDVRDDWGREILVASNEDGGLAAPELRLELSEDIVDVTAGKDERGDTWLALSTFTFRSVSAPPEWSN